MRWAGILIVFVLSLGAGSAARAAGAEEPLPAQGAAPPGANDFSCKPSPRHPFPVVLVHGTGGNMMVSWNLIAPALTRLGYCVFALDYGNSPLPGINGTQDIPTSAAQLRTFVKRVRSRTGAARVAIVGHSQGGMMPRHFIKFLGGRAWVDELVGLSPSNHGTTLVAPGPVAALCPACRQQAAGSAFIRKLNAGDETPGPVDYTNVQTRNDTVVLPFSSAFLAKGPRVTNVLLQDRCPANAAEHVGIIYDPVAAQWVLHALGRPGPANPTFRPDCSGAALATFPNSYSAPRARLRFGRLSRPAGRTRDLRIAVAIRSQGGTVRRARVLIRAGTAKGRVVGRSHPARVGAGRRFVSVRLGRQLGPGRFVATASGTDPTGRRARGRRAFRLR